VGVYTRPRRLSRPGLLVTRFRPKPNAARDAANARAVHPAQPPDEQTYAMLVEALDRRRIRLDRLREELADSRRALAAFETDCQTRVGDLVAALRDATAETEAARVRLQRLVALAGEAGHEVLEQVVEEISGRLGVDLDPSDFAADVADAAQDAPGDWFGGAGEPSAAPGQPAADRLDPATRSTLKRLYRDLAKRCHPDLAASEPERARREALMQRVNEAFAAGDAESLRAMLLETESDDPAFTERPVEQRLAWARAELARLDRHLDQLRREMTDLQVSDVYKLWRRHAAGEPVFDDLEADLERRIRAEGRLLDRLVASYRAVVSDSRLDEHIDNDSLVQ
ncbi:MAG: hypothetical protein ACR2J8_04285, partial [Thermomicrobiales bacterium]